VENAADKAPTVKLLELTAPTSYIQQPKNNPHHYLDFPSSSNTLQRKSILLFFFLSKPTTAWISPPALNPKTRQRAGKPTSVCVHLLFFLSLFSLSLLSLSLARSLSLSLTHTHKHTYMQLMALFHSIYSRTHTCMQWPGARCPATSTTTRV
jgi:hypothetical protein